MKLGRAERTCHQELAEELHYLEPERVLAIAVHQEIERLAIAVPPLFGVLAAAQVAAEHVSVPEEQGAEARGHADGVDENEDDRHNGIRLVGIGVAVDSVVRAMEGFA